MPDRKINFMSQSQPFTGYLYHEKEVDLGKLWKTFIDSGRENWEYRNSYGFNGTQSIAPGYVDMQAELQLKEKEDGI